MIENAVSPVVEEGYTCVSYDYPGYGHSSGKPSELGCYEAIDAVFTKLIQDKEIFKNQIVLWGRSLGTGPSCYLAAREKTRRFAFGNSLYYCISYGYRNPHRSSMGSFSKH